MIAMDRHIIIMKFIHLAWTEPHINPEVEDLVVADDADVHPPVQGVS